MPRDYVGRQRLFCMEVESCACHSAAQPRGTTPGVRAPGSSSSSGAVEGDPLPAMQATSDSPFWSLVAGEGEDAELLSTY